MLPSSIAFIDKMIKEAMERRCSDIHINPCSYSVEIKYRIDGNIYHVKSIPLDGYSKVVGRIKVMSGMDTTERRLPQEGKFQFKFNEEMHDIRVSVIPTIKGEKISIRILYNELKISKLSKIGFNENAIIQIRRLLKNTSGMILISGPTGSGKTTTLYSMLNEIHNENSNIITIEDPVEYSIDGINQISVNSKIGLTFSEILKSVVRQDPDVIMLGEIRDKESAEISLRASVTGHLVMSTIHTSDAPSAILRLLDMGIPKYMVGDAINAVIAQRLIKKLCPYCKEKDESIIETIAYKSKGCDSCDNLGYSGRALVYEVMEIHDSHREIINNNFSTKLLKDYSIKNGMKSLNHKGMELLKKGITSLDELNKM